MPNVIVSISIDTADAARKTMRRASEMLADPADWRRTTDARQSESATPRRTLSEALAKAAEETPNPFLRYTAAAHVLAQILRDHIDLDDYNDDDSTTHSVMMALLHDAALVCDYIIKG